MNKRILGGALLLLAGVSSVASARNFHCAGGIQYVIQGMAEKGKGNLDDAKRIFGKAIVQLDQCVKEDPNDNESWSYLGWAYAELDSACEAGAAFAEGQKHLAGDPKKLDIMMQNWHHYWVEYYNAGLSKYRDANNIMPVAEIPGSTDPKAAEAKAKLAEAEIPFRKAICLQPDSLAAYNNLAIVYELEGKTPEAVEIVNRGLAKNPNDVALNERKTQAGANNTASKLKSGDYKGALDDLDAALAKDPNNYGLLVNAAQTSFEWAEKTKDKDPAGAKANYARAMGYYGRAADAATKPEDKHDMRFNQAIAAQNAGDDLNEAKIAFQLVQADPKNRDLHAMLRGAYDRMGSKKKSGDEVWVILGLNDKSTPVADVAGYTAKVAKASEAGKTLAAMGPPEEIKQFKAESSTIDIWYYWNKKQVFAFSTGRQVGTANFGDFGPETTSPGAEAANAPGTKKPAPKPAPKAGTKKG